MRRIDPNSSVVSFPSTHKKTPASEDLETEKNCWCTGEKKGETAEDLDESAQNKPVPCEEAAVREAKSSKHRLLVRYTYSREEKLLCEEKAQ